MSNKEQELGDMNFTGVFKKIIRKSFNLLGYDIIRIEKSPHKTLLGLKNIPIKTILDIGANEGQFAKFILNFFPEAHLYCFEPLFEPFKKVKLWAEKSNKISIFNIALGEKEGEVEMYYHVEHSPSSSILKTTELNERIYPFVKSQKIVKVKMTTLDKWLSDLPDPLTPEILIKLDVQGYEDRVIKGGMKTFKLAKACILEVCLDRLYEKQANFENIVFLLHNLGYHYKGNLNQTYSAYGHIIYIDAVFSKE